MATELLIVKNLKKYFRTVQGVVKAVDGVSFTVLKGEIYGLVGESGSGKSTIGYTILGAYEPTEGEILFKGQNISRALAKRSKALKREIQMVFQDPSSSLNPRKQVRQILELPLRVHGVPKKDRIAKLQEMLALAGLPQEFMFKYPRELGGGERQTVGILRALILNPSFIILDEPTSALDVSIQAKIIRLLLDAQKQLDVTYLFITHDLSLMRNVANRVAIMYLGKIREQAATAEFFRNPLHPYTQMLLSSIPVISEEEEILKPRKIMSRGEIPSPVNVPPGCAFHLRCPQRMDICSRIDPKLVEITDGHLVGCHLFAGDGGTEKEQRQL